jgi:hypothetical protein
MHRIAYRMPFEASYRTLYPRSCLPMPRLLVLEGAAAGACGLHPSRRRIFVKESALPVDLAVVAAAPVPKAKLPVFTRPSSERRP